MTLKLKLGLPFLQVVLALGLLVADDLWERARPPQCMPEASPALKWLLSIDLPAVVPVVFWFHRLSNPWNQIMLLAAIGLFWYWVALTLVPWPERRRVRLFSFVPLRLVGNLLPVSAGVLLISLCWLDVLHDHLPASWLQFALLVAWGIALVLFFGWDFIRCVLCLREFPSRLEPFNN
jgi:hypothetical protein